MGLVKAISGCLALASLIAGASHLVPDSPVLLAASPSPLVLNLQLTTTQALAPASTAALMAETNSIWRDGHIQLRWLTGDAREAAAPASSASTLRVVVMSRVVPPPGEPSPWTVGELVRMEGARTLAIASITGARRIVEESGRLTGREPPDVEDYRLGVVLGRAVAHEIGHYLLRTNTHATHGLMRATIDAREFADLRSQSFRLDKAAQSHLAALAARGIVLLEPQLGAFSYPER